MNRTRRIQAAAAALLFAALYAAGWLWPLVRITLSMCGFTLVLLTMFLGARLAAKAWKKDESQPPLASTDFMPVLFIALGALLAFVLLAAVPASKSDVPNRRTVTHESLSSEPGAETSARRTETGRTQTSSQSDEGAEVDPASQAAAEFLGALLGASAEQQHRQQADPRYQSLQQSLERASVCLRCGGAGVYRYVDGSGVLQSQACPSCYGSGRAF